MEKTKRKEAIWIGKMTEIIARGMDGALDRGEIDLSCCNGDATVAARIFMQAMEGTKRDFRRGSDVEQNVRDIVHFFTDALTARSPAANLRNVS